MSCYTTITIKMSQKHENEGNLEDKRVEDMEQKKILIVGKLDDITDDINKGLSEHFSVQLCTGSVDVLNGMMKIVKPDLVVINLVGYYKEATATYRLLSTTFSNIPVITVGNSMECMDFLSYYQGGQFENMKRPVTREEIFRKCCEKIGVRMEHTSALEKKTQEPLEQGSQENKKKHILVVDDSAIQLRNVQSWLKDSYKISLAISGTQAMTAVGKQKPDLILLDYEMPVCNGKQVFEMLRADQLFQDIPVVFLTSMADKEHIEEVLKLKPEGYLLKPVALEKLLEVIEGILE